MPRNTQGGSGHKKKSNKGGRSERKNESFFRSLYSDIQSEEEAGIHVGRVVSVKGNGRFEVFYVSEEGKCMTTNSSIRGSLRSKSRETWLGVGSFVVLHEMGLGGNDTQIVCVLNAAQLKMIQDDLEVDPRVLAIAITDTKVLEKTVVNSSGEIDDGGFEWDRSEEIAAVKSTIAKEKEKLQDGGRKKKTVVKEGDEEELNIDEI
jgi:hypothetical protein